MKKWSKKKKVLSVIALIIVLAIGACVVYYIVKPDEGTKVTLTTVNTGTITQKLETSGTVQSANQGAFELFEGTKANEVLVRVGDKIEKGQLLATFDTESLEDVVAEKKKAYSSAKSAYDEHVESASTSAGELAQVNSDIAVIEARMAQLEAAADEDGENEAVEAENETGSKLFELLGIDTSDTLLGKIINSITGNNSSLSAVKSLMSGSSMSSFDISSIGSALGQSEEEQQLISDTLELVQLKARQVLLQTQSSGTLTTVYKSVYESAKKAYEQADTTAQQLRDGWYAQYDGIVREVNIAAGEEYVTEAGTSSIDISQILGMISSSSGTADISGMLSQLFETSKNGMVIEYYPFEVRFTLGQYDIAKVHMDQPATITSINGDEFEGQVTYISPVASDESSINISSLLGSSGSSSGVEVRVSIPQPDASIIIGFDVDVSLDVETANDAIMIPMSALQYSSEGDIHVYKYDESTKLVTMTSITTGLFDGVNYEVLTGLEKGDIIVKSPQSTLSDGDKISIKEIENTTQESSTH